MNKQTDILVLARPDHSYTIYQELRKGSLDFIYCSFKLFPRWTQRLVRNLTVRYFDENYSNCRLLSLLHIYRTQKNKPQLEKYEKPLFELHLKHLLPFVKPKVIHYWPNFCYDSMRRYKEKHPDVKTFAEIYFPCEHWVLDNMKPVLDRYGLDAGMNNVEMNAHKLGKVMEFEDNFLVPSRFVADTFRQYYPNKNYIIIPYGIMVWDKYVPKKEKKSGDNIQTFVYAGQISIEKGCDLLFEYFVDHSEVELHMYGGIKNNQKYIFEKYKKCTNIIFHGTVPKAMLQQEISQYDAGIHLSRFDAYSLAVGEMMGAGLPVIVSDKTGNFSDILKIGAGVVTSLEGKAIEEKMAEIRNPAKYNQYINNLNKYLCSNPKHYGEAIVDFYKKQLL